MLYQIASIFLILLEGLLIILSLKFVHNTNKISTDFAKVFGSSKVEILNLFQELRRLIEITSKRENHMLHTTFHLSEIEMYVKMILKDIEKLQPTVSNNDINNKS